MNTMWHQKRQVARSVGKDMEKLEISCIAGGELNGGVI
jgi:hypothetical protein